MGGGRNITDHKTCFHSFYNFWLKHFSLHDKFSKILTQIYACPLIQYPLFLSDFNETQVKILKSSPYTKFHENLFSHSRAVPCGPMNTHDRAGLLYAILWPLSYRVCIYFKYSLIITILQVTHTENAWCYLTNFSYNTAVVSKITQQPSVKHTTKPTSQNLAAITLTTLYVGADWTYKPHTSFRLQSHQDNSDICLSSLLFHHQRQCSHVHTEITVV